jgi:phosphoribosylformylglycinamidine synthase subunit PurSL
VERLALARSGPAAHDAALRAAARELGIAGVRDVRSSTLYFFSRPLDDTARALVESVLIDPLLDVATWGEPAGSTVERVVESALHAGVSDRAAHELERIVRREGIDAQVATGRRFELVGTFTDDELGVLIAKLLANPVIERWVVDGFIVPAFADDAAPPSRLVEHVEFTARTSDDELARIDEERSLSLDPQERRAVRDHFVALGRPATDVELETIAQTWSEHCSHKSFRARVRDAGTGIERPATLLGALRSSTERLAAPFVVSAFDGNAGIVSFTPGRTYAVKCETHNHPSAIEPFGGANTGVGGVIRDVLGAGHLPVAVTDMLCFGPLDTDPAALPAGVFHPSRVAGGVIDGIADYGNKMGIPTVAGAVWFDDDYLANPLVFAGCIGTADDWRPATEPAPGDRVIVIGGRTGRDGLRGATFSSRPMDATTGDVAGASVQIGDPVVERLVADVLADAVHLYRAITDCGAGGLSSAVGEMAERVGADVELDAVPLKYPGLDPWEVWLSEAQERMVLAVAPSSVDQLAAVCRRHGVECSDIGAFTGDGRLVVRSGGTPVLDLDCAFLHDGRPGRTLEAVLPAPLRATDDVMTPAVIAAMDPADLLCRLLGHPNIRSRADIVHRYDHEIRGATVVRPIVGPAMDGHGDGVVIAEPSERAGVAIGIGMNPWFGLHDPERMAVAVVDEAIRNVVAVGADPDRVALLDNFSWGDPRRPSTFGELVAAVDGCIAAAEMYAAPFVSGKDSLNNEFLGADGTRHAIPPTLVITAVAHVPDADRTITSALTAPDSLLVLLGDTHDEWAGSHAAAVADVDTATTPMVVPAPDPAAPDRYRALHRLIADGVVRSCHDGSEGGLAVAVAEMSIAGRLGAVLDAVDEPSVLHRHLFAESVGRFVIEIDATHLETVRAAVPGAVRVIGRVTGEQVLVLPDGARLPLEELVAVWSPAGDAR